MITTENLKLDYLSDPSFWVSCSDEGSKKTPLVVVLPSGRSCDATSGHLALVSDALYTHEAVIEIDRICRLGGMDGVLINSMLDIDYYDYLCRIRSRSSKSDNWKPLDFLNANLLVLATADINVISKILLTEFKSMENYKIGYKKPYEDCIVIGGNRTTYAVTAYPNAGVLALYPVPWATKKRVAIFCGGTLAPGTLGAILLLNRYLCGQETGNNSFLKEVPLRIVSSSIKDYRYVRLFPTASCIPQHELRNITGDILIHE